MWTCRWPAPFLSSKAGKEAYVQPVVEGDSYRFEVHTGTPPESAKGGTTAGKRAAFICLLSGSPIDYNLHPGRRQGKAAWGSDLWPSWPKAHGVVSI
jgi:hypothetical protein